MSYVPKQSSATFPKVGLSPHQFILTIKIPTAMAKNLKFGEQYTADQFKEKFGGPIRVLHNPSTGKVHFRCGNQTGMVSDRFLKEDGPPMVVHTTNEKKEKGWMLYRDCNCVAVV